MKAFLSHSSTDKPFVEEVGKELGRQHYLLDKHEFDLGQSFKAEISRCLKNAETFVLFASRAALKSDWVSYEIDIAEDKKISGLLEDALVFLLEDVAHTDLPPWLSKGLVVKAESPKVVAREIGKALDKRLGAMRSVYFFGRNSERDRVSKALNPISGNLPRAIAVIGLPGIGRRTLLEDIARNYLQYKNFYAIEVESGDELQDLLYKLAAEKEFWADGAQLKSIGEVIRSESVDLLFKRLNTYLTRGSERSFLTLVDSGGLVNEDGNISKVCSAILEVISKEKGLYIGLVLRRLPSGLEGPGVIYDGVIHEQVKALSNDDIERLLVKILSERDVKFEGHQIKRLAEFVRGYPPAAYYAGELAKKSGLDLLLSEPRPMIDFRSRVLASALNGVNSDDSIANTLEVLAFYSPLPLAVIGQATGLNAEVLAKCLGSLIHSSILEVDEDGFYRVSEPLIESAQHLFDRWKTPHQRVAKALQNYVSEFGVHRGGLAVLRGLFRARNLAQLKGSDDEISFPSDLVRLTEDFYHQREFDRALEIGNQALLLRPQNVDALSFMARSYAQLGRFDEATGEAQKVRDLGALKEYYFLMGFSNRLQSNLPEAIRHYEDAVKRGRRGVAINRELASCYFHSGDLQKAKEHLFSAQNSNDRKNRYIVDLLVTIAVAEGDEAGARKALVDLEEVDKKGFFLHRCSTVEFRFGDRQKANELANKAIDSTNRPPFAMLSQRIKCEIATGDLDGAALHIREAEARFSSVQRDSLLALRCKWELADDKPFNANALWEQLRAKNIPAGQVLRRDIIEAIISVIGPKDPRFNVLDIELRALLQTVGKIGWEMLDEEFD
ncbi:hypothetical protein CSQ92_07925 [Janthinobacterium sp. BJB446]|uniref:toll/interleukin-1 receptor domain-containing protein n=1 Tax=Janthinobacterium sp. BJB446 TaxID=2048009 RepID=UPI000C11BF7D|nr:toll/interleukin-1 receptor domain-containing protein [Janthinobacterium sp. BJB446]PHV22939.1 hypothetical protein CSQ92_07925 [Janthinobacterium sp. BJB446]